MRHVAQPCELPHGAFEHTILVTHTSCATPATTRAKAKGGSYVTPSPPTKRSEEPRGAPYHHRYAARHRSTPTCQFWARMDSAATLARFPFDVSRRQMAIAAPAPQRIRTQTATASFRSASHACFPCISVPATPSLSTSPAYCACSALSSYLQARSPRAYAHRCLSREEMQGDRVRVPEDACVRRVAGCTQRAHERQCLMMQGHGQ